MEDACINFTSVARSVRPLKIDGFSLTGTMGSNECVRSRWSFDGYDWEVRIYPAMKCSTDGSPCLVLELCFLSKPRRGNVRVALSCRLVDPRGVFKPSNEFGLQPWVFSCPQECSSKLAIMSRRELAASGYLRGDSFTMQCTITILKELPDTAPEPAEKVPVPSSNLHRDLAELLRTQTGADVMFVVAGESYVHKSILATRSPVFMAQFFGDMKEDCSRGLEIEDMEADVFKALLYYIYTDTVVEFDDEKDEAVTVMAQHLLAAADRYGLDRLKLICEGKLSDGIDVDTVATTLALAEQHSCPQLKAKCVGFIVKSSAVLDDVLATEGYKYLEASCPSVLTDILKSSLRIGGKN